MENNIPIFWRIKNKMESLDNIIRSLSIQIEKEKQYVSQLKELINYTKGVDKDGIKTISVTPIMINMEDNIFLTVKDTKDTVEGDSYEIKPNVLEKKYCIPISIDTLNSLITDYEKNITLLQNHMDKSQSEFDSVNNALETICSIEE